MIRATTQAILEPQTPQAKKVGSFINPAPDTPLEVLKKQMEEETDRGKKTELTKQYNDKMLATYSDLFSKTQAEGQDHTMLEEIEALANMDGGDEKKQRKDTLLQQMEALGMPKDYYGFFAGDGSFDIGNAAKWAGSAAGAGIAGFEKGLFDTANLILGAPLRALGKEDNVFQKAADYFGDIYASNAYNREVYANRMGGGKGLEFAGSAIEGVMGAVPTAVLAMMTGGASLGASTTELQTMAAYRAGNILSKAGITAQTMMQDPQFWVSFARTYGSDYAEAKERGASDTAASLGAMLTSLVNAGIEIGPDGASGIQGLPKEIVGNHDLSTKEKIFDWVTSSLEEGGEEILQKGVTDLVTAAAYPNKEGLFDPEEYLQEGALGAISGAVMGAGQLAANEIVDAVNSPERFTRYEQAVLNNEIQSRIAEAEQNGPVSKAQMAKIRESAIHDLKMGYLSTDSIEGVLGQLSGSDAYTSYQALMGLDEDTQFLSEYDALGARQDLTPEEAQKYTDMGARAKEIRDAREAAKSRLSQDVQEMVDGGRLSESYAEIGRRRERFTADLDIYPDGAQKQVIQNAMESGVLNNTNRSHELVDLVSQIAADKGIPFDFTNNAHLKAAGLDIDGVTVNGFVSDKGVTLNVNSDKALNSVVGHEITHVLEGTQAYTELQRALFDYAKSKGEFESRFDSLADTYRTVYKGLDDAALREKINQELTADLIGDLMFTDSDFVKQLSARNQNVFQKIYSEVQYLAQAAKGGSKAGQLLQEAQRAFQDASHGDAVSGNPSSDAGSSGPDLGPVAEKWQIKGEDISLEEELETLRDLGKTDFQAEEDIMAGINEEPNEGTQTEEDFPIGPEPETRAQEQTPGVEGQDVQQEANVNAEPEEQTPADRVKKGFRDKAFRDAVKSSGIDTSDPENVRKVRALSKAVEQAQDFCSKGIVGVKSIPEIFNQFIEDGSLADFESYLRHELNVDRCTLEERFGTENKPVFGPDVTAEISRQRAAELLQQHPKFQKAAEDVYTFTRYLKDMMVRGGKMSQGLADHLQEMYPHYIPIGRTRNGYQPIYGQILDFLQGGYIDMDDGDALNVFLGDVDDATGIKGITSYGTDFDSLQNSLVDYAMRAHMALAMGTDTFDTDAPLFNETRSQHQASTDYGPVAGQNEAVKAPDMDVPDFGEPGQNGNAAANPQTSHENDSVPVADNDADALDFLQEEPNDQFLDLDGEGVHPAALKSMVQYRSPIRIALDFLGEHLFDKGIVFESLGDKVGDRGLPALWHAMRTAASKGQYLIGNGDKSKGIRALADIYKEVKKSGKMVDFSSYISNLRNMDGLSLQARYGVAKDQAFVKNVSYADSVSIVRELENNNPKFKTWAQDLFAYSNNLVDMMVDSGTLSEGNAELLRELYPHYVPVRYGKDGKLKTPFDSLGSLTMEVAKGTATNEFSQRLSGTLQSWSKSEAVDIQKVIGQIDRGKSLFQFDEDGMQDGYHTYTVYDGDKKLTYRISDRMYSAMKPVADLLNVRVPGLSGFSNLSRNLITTYDLFFGLFNAAKDFQEVVLHSQHPVETYASMPKAIFEIATKGDLYQEYVTNGGEYCTYFDAQEGTFDAKKGVTDYLENMIGLKQIIAVNDFIESIPRFSEYMASREKGKPIAEAMLDAAQVTVNFSAGGDVSKFIDRNGCTFFNASMQGAMQIARDINHAKMNGLKGWLGLITRCLVAGVPPVVAAAMFHKDDDDYDELPDYVKENYYLPFKFADGTYVRIPKGRTNAVIQYAMEQVAKASKGDDAADWKTFLRFCVENVAPNNPWNDNVIAPIKQVLDNKSWFGEDIVPYRLKDLPAAEQYDEKTDLLSIWLGEKLNYSPKKINYLLNQYSGVLGDTVLPFLTPKAESPYDNPVAKVMAPLRDRFTTDVVLNNRVTGDFYEALEAAEVKAQEEGATMEDKLLSSVLIGYNVKVSKLMKQQRGIQGSGLLDSEKFAQNKELKRQINDLEREALEAANQMKITGVYAEAGGNRYNYGKDSTTGEERWFEITPTKKDGTDNWFYKQEQAVTKGLGISPAEYWNHRQMYDDFYYVAAGYDKDSTADDVIETARAVFGYERFAEYASVLKTLRADKDADGNPIRGTKFKKVQAFVDRLDIPDIEKKILMKMQYPSNNRNSYEIVQWLDENDSISRESFVKILGELGYKIDDQGMVTWW